MPGDLKEIIGNRIKKSNWLELESEWNDLLITPMSNNNKGWALEFLICRVFELEGSIVRYPYDVKLHGINSEQIDGAVYLDNIVCLIECKNQSNPINFEPISKLRSQLQRRPSATIGAIFTTSSFTEPALILAQYTFPQTILLWEKEEIDLCIKSKGFKAGLVKKYNNCVEMGLSNYSLLVK